MDRTAYNLDYFAWLPDEPFRVCLDEIALSAAEYTSRRHGERPAFRIKLGENHDDLYFARPVDAYDFRRIEPIVLRFPLRANEIADIYNFSVGVMSLQRHKSAIAGIPMTYNVHISPLAGAVPP